MRFLNNALRVLNIEVIRVQSESCWVVICVLHLFVQRVLLKLFVSQNLIIDVEIFDGHVCDQMRLHWVVRGRFNLSKNIIHVHWPAKLDLCCEDGLLGCFSIDYP